MRIASFNVENLTDDPANGAALSERNAVLRPQLDRIEADILCLQEVDASRSSGMTAKRSLTALDALLAETAYRDFHRASSFKPQTGEPRDKHNLVILSRWPIERIAQYAQDLAPAPRYRCVTAEPPGDEAPVAWDRPILCAHIRLPGGAMLSVINMHLKAPLASFIPGQKIGPFVWKSVAGWAEGYYLAAMKRAGQALEARLLIDSLFDGDPEAVIAVCGDFNAEERDTPARILIGDTEDTGNGRLIGRELVALEHSVPNDRRYTVIHAGRKLMLDHILVSRALLAHYRGMEIHNEALGDEIIAYTLVDRTPESYHAPVVAVFDLADGT